MAVVPCDVAAAEFTKSFVSRNRSEKHADRLRVMNGGYFQFTRGFFEHLSVANGFTAFRNGEVTFNHVLSLGNELVVMFYRGIRLGLVRTSGHKRPAVLAGSIVLKIPLFRTNLIVLCFGRLRRTTKGLDRGSGRAFLLCHDGLTQGQRRRRLSWMSRAAVRLEVGGLAYAATFWASAQLWICDLTQYFRPLIKKGFGKSRSGRLFSQRQSVTLLIPKYFITQADPQ